MILNKLKNIDISYVKHLQYTPNYVNIMETI